MAASSLESKFPGLFQTEFEDIPFMANKDIAKGTRYPNQEKMVPADLQLKYVAVYDGLVDEVEKNVLTFMDSIKVDISSVRTKRGLQLLELVLDPNSMSKTGITKVICCENDTRDWFKRVFAEPATVLLDIVNQSQGSAYKGPDLDPGRKIYQINSASRQSDPGVHEDDDKKSRTIPDLLLIEKMADGKNDTGSTQDHPSPEKEKIDYEKGARCAIELKTSNAYSDKTFKSLYSSESGNDGVIRPFIWFTDKTNKVINGTASKLIIQAYYQMVDRNVHYGVISNYKRAIFLYRSKKMKNALIMSKEYHIPKPVTVDPNSKEEEEQPNSNEDLEQPNSNEDLEQPNSEFYMFKLVAWFAQACKDFIPEEKKLDLDNNESIVNIINNISGLKNHDKYAKQYEGQWGLLNLNVRVQPNKSSPAVSPVTAQATTMKKPASGASGSSGLNTGISQASNTQAQSNPMTITTTTSLGVVTRSMSRATGSQGHDLGLDGVTRTLRGLTIQSNEAGSSSLVASSGGQSEHNRQRSPVSKQAQSAAKSRNGKPI